MTALRVSDLLTLQIGDMVNTEGNIRERFVIREEKRRKRNVVTIRESVRAALTGYLEAYPGIEKEPANFLFFSTRRAATDFTLWGQ